MAKKTITLGTVPTVETVFAYKNIPDQNESLEETVKHWLGQTLARDGFDNATINVSQSVRWSLPND
jgi:serine/threonine protein phosphatase PrpC